MKNIKSHFKFNKQERSGIFFLLFIIAMLQLVHFLLKTDIFAGSREAFTVDSRTQREIDVLKKAKLQTESRKIFPFNPNFISDSKGYALGMSTLEIDRLLQFRAQNNYVNSVEEFQAVTLISDSLLARISPYFKFPEWTKERSRQLVSTTAKSPERKNAKQPGTKLSDLNSATAEELRTVSGIGEKLSARIIAFREGLGGFLISDQLYDVYGLDSTVVKRALNTFGVLQKPDVELIHLNTATRDELAQLLYLSYDMAAAIVAYRKDVGQIDSFDELKNIENFPAEKIDRIALYLRL